MATAYQNLSEYDVNSVPDASHMSFGIVVAEWNRDITEALLKGAMDTLQRHGVKTENIYVERVPGTFELPYGAKMLAEFKKPNAVITLGCVVRGDTPHFDYVCQGVTQGVMELNTREGHIPVIFGVLTNNTMQQSFDRAGGILGNKGDEAAVTAIKMADMTLKLKD